MNTWVESPGGLKEKVSSGVMKSLPEISEKR